MILARRSEYWWWILFTIIVGAVTSLLDNLFGLSSIDTEAANGVAYNPGWISIVAGLALLVPTLAVRARRLHDIDKSGWWQLLALLCCIGEIIVLFWMIKPGDAGPNRFGPDPKGLLGGTDMVPPAGGAGMTPGA